MPCALANELAAKTANIAMNFFMLKSFKSIGDACSRTALTAPADVTRLLLEKNTNFFNFAGISENLLTATVECYTTLHKGNS